MEDMLFRAIGEVDEALLACREKHVKSHHLSPIVVLGGLAACACLALAICLLEKSQTPEPPAPVVEPSPRPKPVSLQLDGGDVGEFHLYQTALEAQSDLVLHVNQESHRCREEDGTYLVEPVVSPPSELPLCRLEIVHQKYIVPQYAAKLAAEKLAETYAEVSDITESTVTEGLTVSGRTAPPETQPRQTFMWSMASQAVLMS